MVGTFTQPDFETQGGTAYKTNLDNAIAAISDWGAMFAPHEQDTPDMTVRLDAGTLFDGTDLIVLSALDTGTITAPSTNPRKDIVYIDPTGGGGSPLVYIGVQTGSEAASPADPTLASGLIPIARINLTASTTAIANTDIDDLRGAIWDQSSGGYSDPLTTRGDIVVRGASSTGRLALGSTGQVLVAGANDPSWTTVGLAGLADAAKGWSLAIEFAFASDGTADDAAVQRIGGIVLDRDVTFSDVEIYLETAPTGQAMVFDVHYNGSTIFSTNPEVDASAQVEDGNHAFSTTEGSAGGRLDVYVDQIGSGTAGGGGKFTLVMLVR